jgi:BASS family bile acid:Na+ symporter
VAIIAGLFFPSAEYLTFIIRYNLMVMLFFAFLEVRLSFKLFHRTHLTVALFNLLLPLIAYFLLYRWQPATAEAVFAIASAPTAAAGPVIASFLGAQVGFVTTSVLLTSPIVAMVLPFTASAILGGGANSFSFQDIALPIASLIFIPMLLSLLVRRLWPQGARWVRNYQFLSFWLFLINVFIAAAAASSYFQGQQSENIMLIMSIGLAIGGLCLLQFKIGEWLGRGHLPLETGLALGRKNTMFSLWLALTYFSPAAALGPIFYILAQNLYNSWQIYAYRQSSETSSNP